MTYLITFACYGAHMHGEEPGSVDRTHRIPGSPLVEPSSQRVECEKRQMDQLLYAMDGVRRQTVLAAIMERCADRRWHLKAAHVRTNHVHIVLTADARPERVMNDLKSYAS